MEHDMSAILIVDDEDFFRERLIKAFQRRNYKAFGARSYEDALAAIKQDYPEMAVIDLKMPGKSGLELIKSIKTLKQKIDIVVLTGYGSITTAIEAVKLGALGYISKPADVDEILAAFANSTLSKAPNSGDAEKITVPSLARVEWEHINRVLADCDGNISLAAKRLGLHRRSLQRKLLKYPPKI
jgi:two-component system response regulator RegA